MYLSCIRVQSCLFFVSLLALLLSACTIEVKPRPDSGSVSATATKIPFTPTPTLASSEPTTGARPERVAFGTGESMATRNGILAAGIGFKQYVLEASSGQVLDVWVNGGPTPINFGIESPSRTQWFSIPFGYDASGAVQTVALPENGDYTITLTTPNAAPDTEYEIVFEVLTPSPWDEAPEQVQFERGSTSAARRGALLANGVKRYVLEAGASQTMNVRVTSRSVPVDFVIASPRGTLYRAEQYGSEVFFFAQTVTLPENGDYVITLTTPSDSSATFYDVDFEITGGISTAQPERVQFVRGAISTTLTGDIIFPNRKEYLLRALAGQTMRVEITSPDGQANFAIVGVGDGQPYKRLVNESRTFEFVLPNTQDYRITVTRPAGSSAYSLYIQID